MENPKFKLGSLKGLLSKEEMKKISGGYAICCCYGGYYTATPGYHNVNGYWDRFPDGTGNCYNTCTNPNVQHPGTSGEQWTSSSGCNPM